MSFSRPRLLLLLLAALVVGIGGLACSGSNETTNDIVTDDSEGPIPSAQEARRALNETLQAFNEHCLAPRAQGSDNDYPLTVFNPDPNSPSFKYRQLQTLAQANLLKKKISKDKRGLPVYRFALTEAGKESRYEIAQARRYKPMFCYAVPHVARIDSIKSVYTSDPSPLANVWFAYTYRDLGRWVKSSSIQRAFSGLSSLPSRTDTLRTTQLLIRVDGTWRDRRLTGYERPPNRPSP